MVGWFAAGVAVGALIVALLWLAQWHEHQSRLGGYIKRR